MGADLKFARAVRGGIEPTDHRSLENQRRVADNARLIDHQQQTLRQQIAANRDQMKANDEKKGRKGHIMRAAHYLLAVAIASGLPATAMAQSTTTTPSQPVHSAQTTGQWFASGFVGSNFNARLSSDLEDRNIDNNSSNSSLEFGGNIGYTWNRVFGVEFLADFTPGFGVSRILNADEVNRLVDDPRLNTYMFNAIAAVPIGAGRWQPFISGGLGGVSLAADVLDNPLARDGSTTRASRSRMGSNIGGGVFTFADNVGVRADVRYFHSSTDNRTETIFADQIAENIVSGLSFWRANVGIAFRW